MATNYVFGKFFAKKVCMDIVRILIHKRIFASKYIYCYKSELGESQNWWHIGRVFRPGKETYV